MPYARRTPSVTSLPGGKEYYRACLKWHLSLNITPKEIYDLGEAEVHRISGNIKKVKEGGGGGGAYTGFN